MKSGVPSPSADPDQQFGIGGGFGLDGRGQRGNGRRAEDHRHRQIGAQFLFEREHHVQRHQGIAAEVEEIGIAVDVIAAEQPLPDRGDHGFDRAHWRGASLGRVRDRVGFARLVRAIQRLQSLDVELGAGQARNLRDAIDALRLHMGWQAILQRGFEVRRPIVRHALARNNIADERNGMANAARQHGGIGNARLRPQRRFDFARLDADAANLHLPVLAADDVEKAIASEPHQIAGL